MPIRYVGRKTWVFGRPLWEIILNLKNFGVGRIVVRNTFLRYPEACYYRIVSVQPVRMEYPTNMHGTILTERTWRGVTKDELFNVGTIAYKSDYALIPKHEEEAFINSKQKARINTTVYPRYVDLPPLWQEFVKREKALQKLPVTLDDLRVPLIYTHNRPGRLAEEGETPSFNAADFMPRHHSLYETVNFTHEKKSSQSS